MIEYFKFVRILLNCARPQKDSTNSLLEQRCADFLGTDRLELIQSGQLWVQLIQVRSDNKNLWKPCSSTGAANSERDRTTLRKTYLERIQRRMIKSFDFHTAMYNVLPAEKCGTEHRMHCKSMPPCNNHIGIGVLWGDFTRDPLLRVSSSYWQR